LDLTTRPWEVNIASVGLLLPPRFANLSFAPLFTFEAANMVLGEEFYDMHVVSASGGQIVNSLGMRVETERGDDVALDTLLVGVPPNVAQPAPELVDFLQRASASTRRIASICVGAFILGEAGPLDGRRATTHWLFGQELQRRYPKTRVEVDRIYIADGQIWTSAGMTAGIDLALGLVERDLGPGKAREIARMMVLHHRRAGGQSQHSALLDLDIEVRSDRVQAVLQYARRNLSGNLSVERLAAVTCLSPRQFSRLFRFETGVSPAKAVENLRLEAARFLLEQGRLPIETIAFDTSFGDRERMRRSFLRAYGQPQSIRQAKDPLVAI
jgi:transcriptional regulator GlxA family with amidase domain